MCIRDRLGAELLEGGLEHVLGGQDLGIADDGAHHDEVQHLRVDVYKRQIL